MTVDSLSQGVRALFKTATEFLPANGLGVVGQDTSEDVVLTYVDAFGLTAYRTGERDIPGPFRFAPWGLDPSSAAVRSSIACHRLRRTYSGMTSPR
jgi:hypothetical protein